MDKYNIAFDQFQRYETVAQLIEYHRQNGKSCFKVLEIGANEHKDLSLFLPNDELLFSDIVLTPEMEKDIQFVKIDRSNIPFAENSFDFVVALDVLEHISAEKRIVFFREMERVSSIGAILSFPYDNDSVNQSEQRVNSYFRALSGNDFIWLKEHMENGLPDLNEIDNCLKKEKINYFSFFHGSLSIWERLWYCHFDTVFSHESLSFRKQIDTYYNRNLYQTDMSAPCYRAFYILSDDDLADWKFFAEANWRKAHKEDQESNLLDVLLEQHKKIKEYYNFQRLENLILHNGKLEEHNREVLGKRICEVLSEVSGLQKVEKQIEKVNNNYKEIWRGLTDQYEAEIERLQIERKQLEKKHEQALEMVRYNDERAKQFETNYIELQNTLSWKITKPLRLFKHFLVKRG